jgi:hypothetical protein
MAKVLINRTGTAEVSYNPGSGATLLSDQVNGFEINSATEMSRADVFANEGEIDQEPGGEQLAVNVSGFLAYDAAGSFVPVPGAHNKVWIFTFHTGCTVTMNADMAGSTMGRPVNGIAYFRVALLSKPGWAVAWDVTGA